MDADSATQLVFRLLHIFPAVILLGGVFFIRLALWPAVSSLEDAERQRLQAALRRRWAMWVGISAGLLLLSGIVNTVLIVRNYEMEGGAYHGLLGLKVLLALAIIYIASMLAGRSEAAERFRQKAPFWINANIVLSILLICVAGFMRMTDRTEKDGSQTPAAPTASAADNEL